MSLMMKKLVEDYKKFPTETIAGLKAALKEKQIGLSEFSIQEAFIEDFGMDTLNRLRRDRSESMTRVIEAAGAVSTSAFLNITQQFAFAAILEAYDLPELVVKQLIPKRQSNFRFERVPGVSHIGDTNGVVEEGREFGESGVSEDFIDTPETRKRGRIVPVTKEAIFFDHTSLVMERCRQVGEWLGVNDEKRAIDCVIDAGESATMQYRYRWRGNTIATYGNNSGTHSWDNLSESNTLTDYTSINTAWQLLVAITDPFTGEPQNVTAKHLVVPPSLAFVAPFALNGMVRRTAPGYATSGNPAGTEIDNPTKAIVGSLQIVTSQLIQARQTAASQAAGTWFMGDIGGAFEKIENWSMQTMQLGAGSADEFKRDVVMQFRADERGTYNTKQPRKMVKCTVA